MSSQKRRSSIPLPVPVSTLHLAEPELCKDRKYHLKTYKHCFLGSDLVTWLLEKGHVKARKDGLGACQAFYQLNVIRHVEGGQPFKDDKQFYKFIFSDPVLPLRVLRLANKDLAKDRTFHFQKLKECFSGAELITWLITKGHASTREEALTLGRKLEKVGQIQHTSNRQPFKDDNTTFFGFIFPKILEGTMKCAVCGGAADLRCSVCKASWYCGERCQRDDWPTHQRSCVAPSAGGTPRVSKAPTGTGPQQPASPTVRPSSTSVGNKWKCVKCNMENLPNIDACKSCATPNPKTAKWSCPQCTYVQSAQTPFCTICQTKRPEPSEVAKYAPVPVAQQSSGGEKEQSWLEYLADASKKVEETKKPLSPPKPAPPKASTMAKPTAPKPASMLPRPSSVIPTTTTPTPTTPTPTPTSPTPTPPIPASRPTSTSLSKGQSKPDLITPVSPTPSSSVSSPTTSVNSVSRGSSNSVSEEKKGPKIGEPTFKAPTASVDELVDDSEPGSEPGSDAKTQMETQEDIERKLLRMQAFQKNYEKDRGVQQLEKLNLADLRAELANFDSWCKSQSANIERAYSTRRKQINHWMLEAQKQTYMKTVSTINPKKNPLPKGF